MGDRGPYQVTHTDIHTYYDHLIILQPLIYIHYTNFYRYRQLAETGANTLRVPVGDWMFQPYEPFIGCWDGAVEVTYLPTFQNTYVYRCVSSLQDNKYFLSIS